MKTPSKVKIERTKRLFDDFFKIDEAVLKWERFDGTMSDTVRRLRFERGDSVAAVVFNWDTRKVILVNQFRYPTYEKGSGWMSEVVAGVLETDESPETTIRREILEEIGYEVRDLVYISSFYVSPGGSTERIVLFYAEVDNEGKVSDGGGLESEHEDIQIEELTLQDVETALSARQYQDAKTVIGLVWLLNNLSSIERKGNLHMSDQKQKTCFVIMPYGEKSDADGNKINLDVIYEFIIKKAIEDMDKQNGLQIKCVRCDKIEESGSIHTEMFDHIAKDDVAIVDLTTLNPNVFYELGIRHALKRCVTVLIKSQTTSNIPFNIQGLRVISYDAADVDSYALIREKIQKFIKNGLSKDIKDSPVLDQLPDLQVSFKPEPLKRQEKHRFRISKSPKKEVVIITGDIQNVHRIDVWVNSENTNMQMARFYDGSISGLIRYMGAVKDDVGGVLEDKIATELSEIVDEKTRVDAGTVVPTTSGELKESNQVEKIYHVAAVEGVVGRGYSPVRNIAVCITNALKRADDDKFKTILFPLLGTGAGGANLGQTVKELIQVAIVHLEQNPKSSVKQVYFLAWSDAELKSCLSFLENTPDVEPINTA
jgi:ADP-ribose pyrophosphatase